MMDDQNGQAPAEQTAPVAPPETAAPESVEPEKTDSDEQAPA